MPARYAEVIAENLYCLPPEVTVFLFAASPFLELRGAYLLLSDSTG